MVGDQHRDPSPGRPGCMLGQILLAFEVELLAAVSGEMGGFVERDVGWIGVDDAPGRRHLHDLPEIAADELSPLGLGMKDPHLFARKIGPFVASERDIEPMGSIVAAKAVVAVAVQVDEKCGLLPAIGGGVEALPQLVVALFAVVPRGEESLCVTDEWFTLFLELPVELDQVGIDVVDQVAREVGVEKYGAGTGKRLHQTLSGRQFGKDVFQHPIFVACPLEKGADEAGRLRPAHRTLR